jgi:formylglycine-generating enzyme required for sulfatase activity
MLNQYSQYICIVFLILNLSPLNNATAEVVRVRDDELEDVSNAASSTVREVWWPAVRKLGELASGNPVLRDEIWRRAHVNTLGMKFVRIEAGEFTMGPDWQNIFNIQRAHKVKITTPFYIAVTEVTNEEFKKVFPSHRLDAKYSPDADSPAVRITWEQATEFCKLLSEREGAIYRLPTEAEWEYACRAGTTTLYSFGVFSTEMSKYGWCMGDYSRAAAVATLQPNDWGIYDMHGNVFEWVSDWYSNFYYSECSEQGTVQDPKGPDRDWRHPAEHRPFLVRRSTHVLRSCGWLVDNTDNALACTCTARFPLPLLNKRPFSEGVGMRETIGFRIVREVSSTDSP